MEVRATQPMWVRAYLPEGSAVRAAECGCAAGLRVQLEGTENRVTVARNRYIQAVQAYNVLARSFPSNLTAMVFSYQPKPAFAVTNEAAISTPPVVDFNKK